MTKAQIKSILKKIETEKAKVSAARDRIRALKSDLDEFDDAWTDAAENLGYAADAISQLL